MRGNDGKPPSKKGSKAMAKIDYRHHFVMVVDTETANTEKIGGRLDPTNVLVYDCGWIVMDTKGNIYEMESFVNRDIFNDERELMRSAYYGWKLPLYIADLQAGRRKMATTYEIRQKMLEQIEKYHIKEVIAHNANFDVNSLNATQRYTTKSKFRYWFPYGIKIWDTLKMSRDVILKMPTYRKFCEKNGLLTPTGKLSATAENLYRFISKDKDFQESHTGLEDVLIECQIFLYCLKQHKKMRRNLYENQREIPAPTQFQRDFATSLKTVPVLSI